MADLFSLPRVVALAILWAGAAVPLCADIIELKDGTVVQGTMYRQGNTMVISRDDGQGTIQVAPSDVVRVKLTENLTPEQKAEGAWTRAQYDVKHAERFADVLGILEKFAAAHGTTATGQKAAKVLASYREIAAQDPVKFRGKWVPKAQVEVIQKAAEDKAKPAVALYKAGRLREALDGARDALKVDDANPTALAVSGLASYRLNQLPDARSFFTRLTESDTASVLGWNDLAVVCFQSKRETDGIAAYTRALQAASDNRLVLDNVTEAMRVYQGSKSSQAYNDLKRQYQQAEIAMEAKMATRGLYRFASTWVTKEQQDRAQAERNGIQAALTALEAQYNQAARRMDAIDVRIRSVQKMYDAAANDFNYWSAALTLSLDAYSASRRDAAAVDMERARRLKAALDEERGQLTDALQKIRTQAQQLKAALDKSDRSYAGIQRIMDLGDDTQVPPPTPLSTPERPPEQVAKIEIPTLPAPVAETEIGQIPSYPVYPYPGIYTPTVFDIYPIPPAPIVRGGGAIVLPPGGQVIIIPGKPSTPNPNPVTPSPKPKPSPSPSPNPSPRSPGTPKQPGNVTFGQML